MQNEELVVVPWSGTFNAEWRMQNEEFVGELCPHPLRFALFVEAVIDRPLEIARQTVIWWGRRPRQITVMNNEWWIIEGDSPHCGEMSAKPTKGTGAVSEDTHTRSASLYGGTM